MRIQVEQCHNGHRCTFRLTAPDGRRAVVSGFRWSRTVASEARTVAAVNFSVDRRSIRFSHR